MRKITCVPAEMGLHDILREQGNVQKSLVRAILFLTRHDSVSEQKDLEVCTRNSAHWLSLGKRLRVMAKMGFLFCCCYMLLCCLNYFFNLNLTLFCVFFLTYFVLGCRWLRMLWQFSVNNEGTQPYKYVYPFSPKFPSTFIINFDKHSPEESSIVMQTLRNSSFVQSCLSGSTGIDMGKLTGFIQWWKPWVWHVGNGVKGWPTRGDDIIGFIYL